MQAEVVFADDHSPAQPPDRPTSEQKHLASELCASTNPVLLPDIVWVQAAQGEHQKLQRNHKQASIFDKVQVVNIQAVVPQQVSLLLKTCHSAVLLT